MDEKIAAMKQKLLKDMPDRKIDYVYQNEFHKFKISGDGSSHWLFLERDFVDDMGPGGLINLFNIYKITRTFKKSKEAIRLFLSGTGIQRVDENFTKLRKKRTKPSEGETWEHIKSRLEPLKRLAWVPNVSENFTSPTSSKFSGVAVLLKGESWPCCANCNEPMQLFLQINSNDMHEAERNLSSEAFLQVFYCTNVDRKCEAKCKAYLPFSKSTLVRLVKADAENIYFPDETPVKSAFPEKLIEGWVAEEDYPNREELEHLGVDLSDEQSDILDELEYPLPGDKLLGWPRWVQGIEYPNCPECGKSMKLVFQIDSEDNLPFMFGDTGCAHVTQCEDHQDILTIAWACC